MTARSMHVRLPVIILVIGTGILFGCCTAPSVGWKDSGILSSAVKCAGIANPPGFPGYVLACRIFSYLPVGSFPWRVNLFSAMMGALATGLFFILTFRVTGSRSVSMIASGVLAGNRIFWANCLIAEVYTFHAVFTFLILLNLQRLSPEKAGDPVAGGKRISHRYLLLAWFLAGMDLCVHPLALLNILVLLIAHIRCVKRRRLTAHRSDHLLPVLFFMAGLSLLLFIPLRANLSPPVNYGSPGDARGFVRHLLGLGLGSQLDIRRPSEFIGCLIALGKEIGASFRWWPLLFIPPGIYGMISLRARKYGYLIFLGALSLAATALYPTVDPEGWMIMPVALLSLVVGIGITVSVTALAKGLGSATRPLRPGGLSPRTTAGIRLSGLLVPGILLFNAVETESLAGWNYPEEWGIRLLSPLEREAVVIFNDIDANFITLFLREVRGMRTDLTFINPESGTLSRSDLLRMLNRWLGQRPVYTNYFSFTNVKKVPWGLCWKVLPEDATVPWRSIQVAADTLWNPYEKSLLEKGEEIDPLTRRKWSDHHYNAGLYLESTNRWSQAKVEYRRSIRFDENQLSAWNNLGMLELASGNAETAAGIINRILLKDPGNAIARNNLGIYFAQRGDVEAACAEWRRVIELSPGSEFARQAEKNIDKFQ